MKTLTIIFLSGLALSPLAGQQDSPPPLMIGQAVEVYVKDGNWYPARIVDIARDGRPKVRYDGYDSSSDERVDARTVRVRGGRNSRTPASESAPVTQPFIGTPEAPAPEIVQPDLGGAPGESPAPTGALATLEPGQKVEVFARGKWFPATVVERFRSRAEVTYDGFNHSEWVDLVPEWIRPVAAPAQPTPMVPVPASIGVLPAPGGVPIAPTLDSASIQVQPPAEPKPDIPAIPDSKMEKARPVGLYIMVRAIGGVTDRRAFLFTAEGMVFENPTGGVDPFDAAVFTAAYPTRVGKTRFGGGEMEILWQGGRLPASASFQPAAEGKGFEWDFGQFNKIEPTPAASLVGAYQGGTSEPVRTATGWTMGGTGTRLELLEGGIFRRSSAEGTGESEGTYEIVGNTLILKDASGTRKHVVFSVSGAESSPAELYMDGEFLKKLT